ncbi:nucleotide-binding universal stress UspA family protein [Actinoplanes campanulatus]|uniref:Nucleotide-binding universal stress UspA family protein n=1 Tax=Actinoplanes campanulatus TaxID=113559 RepID=A0A7W5AT20_9ACTN|nr:universal stress protein [Actinoplanes campanulatus]MBB3101474.1 nucleotide-binding universal stress UspA family protein [Actinoplanes campanulatus]GGN50672.1 universal stress protein [Actinoplanes campanulatus]GID42069.1 universal stress protein [Actinoplanes campanulatus]
MRHHLIVVGVDGSESGRRALEWAAQEAADQDTAVQAVMAWLWDGAAGEMITMTSPDEERQRAAAILDREVKAVVAEHGSHVPIAAELIEGSPSQVLTHAARAADLLVLGSHGHSPLRHRVLGSVSESCVRKATCPVVVIPSGPAEPEPEREAVLRTATST